LKSALAILFSCEACGTELLAGFAEPAVAVVREQQDPVGHACCDVE